MRMSELTEDRLERLTAAVEQVMADPGFVVQSKDLLKKAEAAGARVDYDAMSVRLPANLLWELAARAPRAFTLRGITGTSYTLGNGGPYMGAIVIDPYIADYPTGAPRKPVLADIVRNTKIIQSHPDVAMVSRMDYPVADVEGPASTFRALEAHLLHHAKPYAIYAVSHESFRQWLDIGSILSGGRPLKDSGLFLAAVAVLSPLVLTKLNCDILADCVDLGIPVIPTVCPMAGSTSPYTLEGTLVQGIAESLMVLCLAQILRPGHPCIFGMGPSITEMSTGHDLYYTMDKVLWKLATFEFSKHKLGAPCFAEMGGALGCRYDMQSGAEGMMMVLSGLMSGADLLSGAGSCLNANGLSSEFIVIHHALFEAAKYLRRGISFDELEESVASIRSQGPGGSFLIDDITLRRLRDHDFFENPLFDTSGEHVDAASRPMLERAHARVKQIEAEYECPVPGDIAEGIRRYLHDYCAAL